MSRPCARCGAASVVNLPPARCGECFVQYLQRTFKTAIGKAGVGGQPYRIAVAISGGPCSAAVTSLLRQYARSLLRRPGSEEARPLLVHVYENKVEESVGKVKELYPEARLKVVRLDEEVIKELGEVKDVTDRAVKRKEKIMERVKREAKLEGCEAVLVGTSVNRAACEVLLGLICGAEEEGEVRIVRVVSGIEYRLLVCYVRGLVGDLQEEGKRRGGGGGGGGGGGIVDVVERFVEEVGEGNRAAVFNVVKTAARLGTN